MVAIPLRRGKALSWGLVVPSVNSSMSWLGRNALSTLHSLYQSAGDQQRRFRLSFKALVYRSFGLSTLHNLYQSAGHQQRRFRLSFKPLVYRSFGLSTLHSLYQSAGDQQRRFRLSFKALVYRSFGLSTLHSLYQSAGHQQRRFRLSFKALVYRSFGLQAVRSMFYDSGQTQDDGFIESYEEESQTFRTVGFRFTEMAMGIVLATERAVGYDVIGALRLHSKARPFSLMTKRRLQIIEKGAYAILFLRLVASRSNQAADSFTSCFWHWVKVLICDFLLKNVFQLSFAHQNQRRLCRIMPGTVALLLYSAKRIKLLTRGC